MLLQGLVVPRAIRLICKVYAMEIPVAPMLKLSWPLDNDRWHHVLCTQVHIRICVDRNEYAPHSRSKRTGNGESPE